MSHLSSDGAEPKGRVCTPDCKIKCYSYCDDGCCLITLKKEDTHPPAPHGSLSSHFMTSRDPYASAQPKAMTWADAMALLPRNQPIVAPDSQSIGE